MSEALPNLPLKPRNLWWCALQFTFQILLVPFMRYRVRGQHRIPTTGGGLLLVNHQSFLDPILIGMPLSRHVSYVARDSLFRVPFLGLILRKCSVIPINRESASSATIKLAVKRMKAGFLIGIFPEGTRTYDGSIGEFKPGFIAMVRRSGVPVYPVGIAGADKAMPRQLPVPRFAQIRVVFGDPFTIEQLSSLTRKGQEGEFVRQVEERVRQCHAEAEDWLQTNKCCDP